MTAQPAFARIRRTVTVSGFPVRAAMSIGMAGFLALMGALSFPLPWTPVPFSMIPFGLLVAGAVQRPAYAAASVVLYLLAGALGAPIFADGASGWRVFVGATAGYLFGFILVSALVGAYVSRPRRMLGRNAVIAVLGAVGLAVAAAVAAISWMWTRGTGLEGLDGELAAWGLGRSTLWVAWAIFAFALLASLFLLARRRGQERAALNLYLVMLASLVILHVCGVTVLWLVGGFSLMAALVLGSVVFLPFDIVKAGLAVAAVRPFLPEEVHA
jgi:biotin transporter BioY